MKKGIILLLVAIIAVVGIFVFSNKYRDYRDDDYETSSGYVPSTTTEADMNNYEGIIAECKEADYKVEVKDEKVIVIHGDYQLDLSYNYKRFIKSPPEFYYMDFDGDGEKEVMLRNVTTKVKNQSFYELFFIEPFINVRGEKALKHAVANSELWKNCFETYITCEFNQLKSDKKFLQFSMNNKGEKINYDEKTGLTDNKFSGYALVPKSADGQYYTLDKWSKGIGSYKIDKNGKITLDVQVLAQYKEQAFVETIGYIHSDISFDKENNFQLVPNSIKFIPLNEKRVCDPREKTNEKWSVEVNNSSEAPAANSFTIDWVESSFDVASIEGSQNMYFSELDSKIKYVDSVVFTQDEIRLIAKSRFSFDKKLETTQAFKVTAKLDGRKDYDIGNTCSIETTDGRSTLVIKLDKGFSKSQMKDVKIQFA